METIVIDYTVSLQVLSQQLTNIYNALLFLLFIKAVSYTREVFRYIKRFSKGGEFH